MKDLNFTNFNDEIENGKTLVFYWATWCSSCKSQELILNSIEEELKDKIKFSKVNISDNRYISDAQKVKNIPSIIFYNEGEEVKRFSEITSRNIIDNSISKLIQTK